MIGARDVVEIMPPGGWIPATSHAGRAWRWRLAIRAMPRREVASAARWLTASRGERLGDRSDDAAVGIQSGLRGRPRRRRELPRFIERAGALSRFRGNVSPD